MLKLYVSGKIAVQEKVDAVVEKLNKKDEGSFLTENLGVVAITIALIAIVLGGMITVIGSAGTGGTGGAGVLGSISEKITLFFGGKGTPTP